MLLLQFVIFHRQYDIIYKLDASKASGPDNIPTTIILKSLSDEISLPLLLLFNKSLSEGQVPREWKTAEVTAIFKKR